MPIAHSGPGPAMWAAGRGGGGDATGFSKGGFWLTELLAQEPQTAAAAVFLGAYPFPDSASLTRNEALSYYTGKTPQLTQECRLSFFSNQHLNTTQRNIRKQVENNHGNITSNYLAGCARRRR